MKLWCRTGLLVLIAALMAWGWYWVAKDPGYVLIRSHGWQVETSLFVAVVIFLLVWATLVYTWRLLRWPFGALSRQYRRRSRRRLQEGLLALSEGRYGDAERKLNRASRWAALRGSCLLASAEATLYRDEYERALGTLDRAAQLVPHAARVLRARVLRRAGKPGEALSLLVTQSEADKLSPSGWRELTLAALACGDTGRAREALKPLRKSAVLGAQRYAALESRVLLADIEGAGDAEALDALWSQLSKVQRRLPAITEAYARRAASFDLMLPAIDEVESALRREWSSQLVEVWGELSGGDMKARLRCGEGWLNKHPEDGTLLLALGRLCLQLQLWDKARLYLGRSLALNNSLGGWQSLGDVYAAQRDDGQAAHCYRQALLVAGKTAVLPCPGESEAGRSDTRLMVPEARDAHGIPHMPH